MAHTLLDNFRWKPFRTQEFCDTSDLSSGLTAPACFVLAATAFSVVFISSECRSISGSEARISSQYSCPITNNSHFGQLD